MPVPPLITVNQTLGSIHLPEMDLWLDPHKGAEVAFISHAHSDHVARHKLTFCTSLTHRLMTARYGKGKGTVVTLEFGEAYEWQGHTLRLLPAGHILGSAMIHLTRHSDGATLLYTGDYKLRKGLTAQHAEFMQADTLIMETTFGLPMYVFPPIEDTVAATHRFVRETLQADGIPVLMGYSLGKAQELLAALQGLDVPIMMNSSAMKLMSVFTDELPHLPAFKEFQPEEAAGHVLILPPMGNKSPSLATLKNCRTAMFSGWAMQPSAKYRYRVHEIFPLSDHADYPELLETVERVQPRRVLTVHGYTREFAANLRRRGYDARALGQTEQLELMMEMPP